MDRAMEKTREFVCVCVHAGIMCRPADCSVIFCTYSDCFPALLLWCLTLLFTRLVYFRQRVTLHCSAPACLFGRVTEQEQIRPSHPEISSRRDERRCVNTPLFPSTPPFLQVSPPSVPSLHLLVFSNLSCHVSFALFFSFSSFSSFCFFLSLSLFFFFLHIHFFLFFSKERRSCEDS